MIAVMHPLAGGLTGAKIEYPRWWWWWGGLLPTKRPNATPIEPRRPQGNAKHSWGGERATCLKQIPSIDSRSSTEVPPTATLTERGSCVRWITRWASKTAGRCSPTTRTSAPIRGEKGSGWVPGMVTAADDKNDKLQGDVRPGAAGATDEDDKTKAQPTKQLKNDSGSVPTGIKRSHPSNFKLNKVPSDGDEEP